MNEPTLPCSPHRPSNLAAQRRAVPLAWMALAGLLPATLRAQQVLEAGFALSVATPTAPDLDGVAVARGGPLDCVYYVNSNRIWCLPRSGGPAQSVYTGTSSFCFLESADGGRLFAANSYGGNLREFAVSGTSLVQQQTFPGLTGSEGLHYVAGGPWAGKLLASNWSGGAGQSLWVLDLNQASPAATLLQTVNVSGFGPLGLDVFEGAAFGNSIYAVAQPGVVYRFSGSLGGTQTTFAVLPGATEAIAFPPPGSAFGDFLYAFGANGTIWRLDPLGNRSTFATGFANSINANAIEFSPDGRELYVAGDNATSLYRIAAATLSASPATLAPAIGGTQTFQLMAGPAQAGFGYWLLGSLSGASPGFSLNGVAVPLQLDVLTLLSAQSPNLPPYVSSMGVLDAQGRGTASLVLPSGFGWLAGLTLHHAFVTFDTTTMQVGFASNPVSLLLQ